MNMLTILKAKQIIYEKPVNIVTKNLLKSHRNIIQNKSISLEKNEYKNIMYYPSSTKEWFSSIYSYNKEYIKSLITFNNITNTLLSNYFNMLIGKKKSTFKRRRPNKIRYSANRIFTSRAEFKHTNTKVTASVYAYNKLKVSAFKDFVKIITINLLGKETTPSAKSSAYISGIALLLKKRLFKSLTNEYMYTNNYLLQHETLNFNKRDYKLYNIPYFNHILSKKSYLLEQKNKYGTKSINFINIKFSNLFANFKGLGINSILNKMFDKEININLTELKSIHLNSDLFASAVSLKLRDRHNKAVKVLKKAVLSIVRVPDLHTLITFDSNIEEMDKKNVLHIISQQVVSGVRFEAAGRLTRRLTAMRAVFKVKYIGSLKNIRSSLNNKSSSVLRGYAKTNTQYTIINSKNRNGTFGLKTWVSSH